MRKVNKYQEKFNIVGTRIKQIRKSRNITQEDLCARMQTMGYQISRSDISKIENCHKFVSDFEVLGFSEALRTTVMELYHLDNNEQLRKRKS